MVRNLYQENSLTFQGSDKIDFEVLTCVLANQSQNIFHLKCLPLHFNQL